MNWTDNQISALAIEGENEVCNRVELIIGRVSLATSVGQTEFVLPDECLDISQITYQGFRLDPNSLSEMVGSQTSPQGIAAGSRPLYYTYNGFGQRVIKVIPACGAALIVQGGDLFNATQIAAGFIVEYYRSPNFTSTADRVPAYIRRPLVKQYVLYRALQQEGPGQYLRGSDFFKGLYDEYIKMLKRINNTMFMSREYISSVEVEDGRGRPARPILPPNYPRSY